MNKQQQELYEKLLKKVNEFCLGQAAEDVIEAIDALVENYEKPKKIITNTKDQLLVEIEAYQMMLRTVTYYVEGKEFYLEDLAKKLKVLEIIRDKIGMMFNTKGIYRLVEEGVLSKEEYELLKETLK